MLIVMKHRLIPTQSCSCQKRDQWGNVWWYLKCTWNSRLWVCAIQQILC